MRQLSGKIVSAAVTCLLVIVLLGGAGPILTQKALAATLTSRSLEMSSSLAGAAGVTYKASFTIATAGTLGSIQVEFCSNSTFPDESCTAPAGLDASNAALVSETGVSGFSLSPNSTANNLILTRPPAFNGAVAASFRFDNITNPTNKGSYYARLLTYPTNDASGPYTDFGGLAFALNPLVNVSVQVPPYLTFCTGNTITGTDCSTAAGDYIDLGEFTPTHTSSGSSQFVVATNAQNGYNVSMSGTTLESGNNVIPAMPITRGPQPGVSQFGINLRANTNPLVGANPSGPGVGTPTTNYNQSNVYQYSDGNVISGSSAADRLRKYTVSYIVDVRSGQPAGIYVSTFTYTALGNF